MNQLRATILSLFAALLFAGAASAQNTGKVLLPSLARTAATVNTADQLNQSGKGAVVIVDVTAFTSGTYTFTVQGRDPASGKYYTILTSAALGATGTVILRIYPGLTAAANLTASDVLPTAWRVSAAGAATPSMTFSVGVHVIE